MDMKCQGLNTKAQQNGLLRWRAFVLSAKHIYDDKYKHLNFFKIRISF